MKSNYPKYKRSYRKRYSKKKSSVSKKNSVVARKARKDYFQNIVRLRYPTPTQTYVKLKVQGILNFTLTTAQINIWDQMATVNNPAFPSGFFTQQPVGWDAWANMMQKFTCHGCALKLEAIRVGNQPGDDDRMLTLTVLPSISTLAQIRAAADTGATTNLGTTCALQCDRFAVNRSFSNANANRDLISLKTYISTATLNPTKDVRDDPDYTGTTATYTSGQSSPANVAYWYIGLQANDVATGLSDTHVQIRVTLTYYTQFSSPLNMFDI